MLLRLRQHQLGQTEARHHCLGERPEIEVGACCGKQFVGGRWALQGRELVADACDRVLFVAEAPCHLGEDWLMCDRRQSAPPARQPLGEAQRRHRNRRQRRGAEPLQQRGIVQADEDRDWQGRQRQGLGECVMNGTAGSA